MGEPVKRKRRLSDTDGKTPRKSRENRAETGVSSDKVSVLPAGGKHGRPRKKTQEQLEFERGEQYTFEDLQILSTYWGKNDNRAQMLADFMCGTLADGKALLAEFDARRKPNSKLPK